jgi:hypothetical protein
MIALTLIILYKQYMSTAEYSRKWRAANIDEVREYQRNYQRKWREENREKVRERALAQYYKHHDRNKASARYRARFTKYGITHTDYNRILESQGGGCGICEIKPVGDRPLCVDHCHDSGKVRGILCDKCNTRLQALEDPIYRAKAEKYLLIHK